MKIKNKRTVCAIMLGVSILAIGGVIAVNNDLLSFPNLFHVAEDKVEATEHFESPENWQPCQEIPKTATATNRNDDARWVRMKINKYWRTADSDTSIDDHTTTDLPLTWSDNSGTHEYGIINTQHETDWSLKDDGWYYYKVALDKDESTTSLLKSVTLNCDANFVESVTYDTNHRSGESQPSDYAGARFHVYVTFEFSSQNYAVRLYDKIASQTNGIDTGVNFLQHATATNNNGNGVNTLAAHASDALPVYYYRGQVDDNYVVMGMKCYRILRTAEGGATKLIYNGEATVSGGARVCSTAGDGNFSIGDADLRPDSTVYTDLATFLPQGSYAFSFPASSSRMARVEYYSLEPGFYASESVTYNGQTGKYNLIEPEWITADNISERYTKYRYSCYTPDDETTECTEVAYVLADNGVSLVTKNGPTPQAILDGYKQPATASTAKTMVDNWFTQGARNHVDGDTHFASASFCNDRNVLYGGLANNGDASTYTSLYAGWVRISGMDNNGVPTPSVDCGSQYDSMTNAVGLITADEVILSGIGFAGSDIGKDSHNGNAEHYMPSYVQGSQAEIESQWLYADGSFLTATPSTYADRYTKVMAIVSGQLMANHSGSSTAIRPVVAVSYDSYISAGDGTRTNPYQLYYIAP